MDEFQKSALSAHNYLRKIHGAPELILSEKLINIAEKHVKEIAKTGTIRHQDSFNYYGNNADISGRSITDIWYNEIIDYDFNRNETPSQAENKQLSKNELKNRHFTQLIWVNSVKFGIAAAKIKDSFYVVAKYYPPGNIKGHFHTNVYPRTTIMHSRTNYPILPYRQLLDSREVRKKTLRHLNFIRECHSAPDLKWDDRLALEANKIAKLILENRITNNISNIIINTTETYGKIVALTFNGFPSFKQLSFEWYSGSKHYEYENGCYSEKSGAFTQIVWNETKHVGTSYTFDSDCYVIVVCFDPPGNIRGKFEKNVKPTTGKIPYS